MSGSHHLLIPLGSSNLSAHYIPMYHCSSSTFSMQCHLLIDGIEPLIPYFPFSPFDSCHCITALPSCHVHQQYHTSKQTREREKERETRLRTMYYSHGTNLGPGSSSYRNHFSHKYIEQHNGYNYNHLTTITTICQGSDTPQPRPQRVQIE